MWNLINLNQEMYYWKKIFNPKSCLPLPVAKKKNHILWQAFIHGSILSW